MEEYRTAYECMMDLCLEFKRYEALIEGYVSHKDVKALDRLDKGGIYAVFVGFTQIARAAYDNLSKDRKQEVVGCSMEALAVLSEEFNKSLQNINELTHPSVMARIKQPSASVYS